MPTRAATPRKGIQSVEVGQRLLSALAAAPGPLALRDLAAQARMPPSKAHRYLVSYGRVGLVEQEGESGHYGLGRFALELGLAALGRLDPVTVASPVIRELARSLDQTVALAVWANHGPVIVRWVGGDSPVSATLRVGSVMPLSRSATGLAFLAHLPPGRWQTLLKRELADNKRNALRPQSADELARTLAGVRAAGLATSSGFIAGITGMAAPVFNAEGTMAMALVVLGYSASFGGRLAGYRQRLIAVAGGLSARLGASAQAARR